eukprot:TRINITY_DN9317_c0_g4_i2.p3 TRINITY_DN9317_c0_g4~~TRINITY_DN9317_c0_g4_i2.p3  ORF type:complete len:124 (-),score=37.25 TRINITY_DN9317_c0_g4_i2:39-410(-)
MAKYISLQDATDKLKALFPDHDAQFLQSAVTNNNYDLNAAIEAVVGYEGSPNPDEEEKHPAGKNVAAPKVNAEGSPQEPYSVPEENPGRIKQLFNKVASFIFWKKSEKSASGENEEVYTFAFP